MEVECKNCGYKFESEHNTKCPRCNASVPKLKGCESCKGCSLFGGCKIKNK